MNRTRSSFEGRGIIGSILCFLLFMSTRLTLGVSFDPEEELTSAIFGSLAVAAGRGARVVVGAAVGRVELVVLVVLMTVAIVEAGLDIAVDGSNAAPCAAVENLHFRISQPALEQ